MTFLRAFQTLNYILVWLAIGSILLTRSYTLAASLGLGITLIAYFIDFRKKHRKVGHGKVITALGLALLAFYAWDTIFGSKDFIGNGIQFVIFLLCVRLLFAKANRDWIQILGLDLVLLLASTAVSTDIGFGIVFFVFLILTTWTLSLFNIKVQIEGKRTDKQNFLFWHKPLSKIIPANYFLVTIFLSFASLFVSLFIFYSFPRVSLGKFMLNVKNQQSVPGFSENIELGTINSIKQNDRIVMRIEFSKSALQDVPVESLYWRGSSADFFDGKTWSKSVPHKRPITVRIDNPTLDIRTIAPLGAKWLEYEVFLEALDTPVLFFLDQGVEIEWNKNQLEKIMRGGYFQAFYQRLYHSYQLDKAKRVMSDLTYRGKSRLYSGNYRALKQKAGIERKQPIYQLQRFLQLPDIDPSVEEVFRRWGEEKTTDLDLALRIEGQLQGNYGYTLQVEDKGVANPLKHFLLDRKEGHCEYFATAMIIALRYHGIPARPVLGFRGGDTNQYGSYLAVRQKDAHSWVEAYFDGIGWLRFDPTPNSEALEQSRFNLARIPQFIDYLKLRWYKYVLQYDLGAQARLVQKIFSTFRGSKPAAGPENTSREVLERQASQSPRGSGLTVFLIAFLGLATLILVLRLRARSRHQDMLLGSLLGHLAKNGYPRASHAESVDQLFSRIEADLGPMSTRQPLLSRYHRLRFGVTLFHLENQHEKLSPSIDAFRMEFDGKMQTQKRKRTFPQ